MKFRSIRWQIQIWYGLLLTFVTGALLVGFYFYERETQIQHLNAELTGPLISLLPTLVPIPGGPPPPPPGHIHHDDVGKWEKRGYYLGSWDEEGHVLYLSAHSPGNIPLPDGRREDPNSRGRWNGDNYEFLQVFPQGQVALIGMPGEVINRHMRWFALVLSGIGLTVITFGLLGGWWVSGRALRPIREITATAKSIAAGDRDQRVVLDNTRDELGGLATVLNETFDRLGQVYDRQLRFTADASHELRTPVTVILAQTQMALSRDRDGVAYREALTTCQRSAQRMKRLLNELLDLSRYDAGELALRFMEADLAEVVRESIDFVGPLATENGATITDALVPSHRLCDPGRLSHVFINLLSNAILHNPKDCRIHVTLKREEQGSLIEVADTGHGIPAESLPHLFERFYRVDQARKHVTGGSGLGLSISKAIVEAHGGQLTVKSTLGQGTAFTVWLPQSHKLES